MEVIAPVLVTGSERGCRDVLNLLAAEPDFIGFGENTAPLPMDGQKYPRLVTDKFGRLQEHTPTKRVVYAHPNLLAYTEEFLETYTDGRAIIVDDDRWPRVVKRLQTNFPDRVQVVSHRQVKYYPRAIMYFTFINPTVIRAKQKELNKPKLSKAVPTVSIIVICKDRLHHVKQSIKHVLSQTTEEGDIREVIYVDYDCPQKVGNYVESIDDPRLRVVYACPDSPYMNRGHARNVGSRHATGGILVFLDADCCPNRGLVNEFVRWIKDSRVSFVSCSIPKMPDGVGNCCTTRELFDRVGGFPEDVQGWGAEDSALQWSLESHGRHIRVPTELMTVIPHDDTERTKHDKVIDKWAAADSNFDTWRRDYRGQNNSSPMGQGRSTITPMRIGQLSRFVILGWGRTGSTAMMTALDRHSQAMCMGEVTKPTHDDYWRVKTQGDQDYLDWAVWSRRRVGVRAIGFKWLHRYDCGEYIKARRDIKVILLNRLNLLEWVASVMTAWVTNRWVFDARDKVGRPELTIHMPPETMLQEFHKYEQGYKDLEAMARGHDVIRINYESMASSWESVQQFLGLSLEPWQPRSLKQEYRPVDQLFSNYLELVEVAQSQGYADRVIRTLTHDTTRYNASPNIVPENVLISHM